MTATSTRGKATDLASRGILDANGQYQIAALRHLVPIEFQPARRVVLYLAHCASLRTMSLVRCHSPSPPNELCLHNYSVHNHNYPKCGVSSTLVSDPRHDANGLRTGFSRGEYHTQNRTVNAQDIRKSGMMLGAEATLVGASLQCCRVSFCTIPMIRFSSSILSGGNPIDCQVQNMRVRSVARVSAR